MGIPVLDKICSAFFGLGAGLFFIGLFPRGRNRYNRDLRTENRRCAVSVLRLLGYTWPVRFLYRHSQRLTRSGLDDLLIRAGSPDGITAGDVIALQVLLALTAAVGGLLLCGVAAITLILIIMAFWAPALVLGLLVKRREIKVYAEQSLFTEVVFMCLKAKLTLKEAIEEAAKTTSCLQPYLLVCLNGWHTDRVKALAGLKRGVGLPGFGIIVDLLTQIADVGDERIADFLEKNKKIEDEIRSINISARSKIRPLLITVQMFLPFVLILIVLFYPLMTQVQKLLASF